MGFTYLTSQKLSSALTPPSVSPRLHDGVQSERQEHFVQRLETRPRREDGVTPRGGFDSENKKSLTQNLSEAFFYNSLTSNLSTILLLACVWNRARRILIVVVINHVGRSFTNSHH